MDANTRREEIKKVLQAAKGPVSATALAKDLNVSRQIIVGDIALLRASGFDVLATARGYITPYWGLSATGYVGKLACQHTSEETKDELYTIVDAGGEVIDVIVEHELYGELTGRLNITCREDVDEFISKAKNARLLSDLTKGVHLHTVACRHGEEFREIKKRLSEKGFLYVDRR